MADSVNTRPAQRKTNRPGIPTESNILDANFGLHPEKMNGPRRDHGGDRKASKIANNERQTTAHHGYHSGVMVQTHTTKTKKKK